MCGREGVCILSRFNLTDSLCLPDEAICTHLLCIHERRRYLVTFWQRYHTARR